MLHDGPDVGGHVIDHLHLHLLGTGEETVVTLVAEGDRHRRGRLGQPPDQPLSPKPEIGEVVDEIIEIVGIAVPVIGA